MNKPNTRQHERHLLLTTASWGDLLEISYVETSNEKVTRSKKKKKRTLR